MKPMGATPCKPHNFGLDRSQSIDIPRFDFNATHPRYHTPSTSFPFGVYFSNAYTSSPTSNATTSRNADLSSADRSDTLDTRVRVDIRVSLREFGESE